MIEAVGILGTGMYLPPEVRRNDWWPTSIVDTWRAKATAALLRAEQSPEEASTEGARRTLAALAELKGDPFQGARERRIMPEVMMPSEMQTLAAKDALLRANVDPGQIDLLLSYVLFQDTIGAPDSGLIHQSLGLPERCMSLMVDAVCNSFAMQLTIAEQCIRGGRARYALLVQGANYTKMTAKEDPISAFWGDGATAVVVGPVPKGKGLLSVNHHTSGKYNRGLVGGVPGRRWWEGGPLVMYTIDKKAGRQMVLSLADWAKQAVSQALSEATCSAEDVDFYASHQGTSWLRPVTQEHCGLGRARHVDIFGWNASMGAANVPMQLAIGEREGLLRDGDLVATFSGGGGVTWSGMVLRWGSH